MANCIFTVAIVGGGIGGLTFALALSRARSDISIDIYESSPNLSESGAGLGLWPRVVEVLHSFGLGEDLTRYAGSPAHDKKMQFRKADQCEGIVWGHTSAGLHAIHRAELLQILIDKTASRCGTHFSKRLTSYECSPDDVITLHFADGTVANCDLLVGADGVKSAVRASMYLQLAAKMEAEGRLAEEVEKTKRLAEPVWSGAILYRSLVPIEALEREYPGHISVDTPAYAQGKGKAIITYPISKGRWVNAAAIVARHDMHGTAYDGPWSVRVSKDEVIAHFAGWDPQSQALVQLMDNSTRWAANTVVDLPTYVSGRAAILGDAAHAMTTYQAAGAGQAVEDGFILACLLAAPETTKETISLALQVYDEIRRPFSQEIVRYSLYTGQTLFLEKMEGVTAEMSLAGAIPKETILKQGEELQELYRWAWTTSALPDRDRALEMYRSRLHDLGNKQLVQRCPLC